MILNLPLDAIHRRARAMPLAWRDTVLAAGTIISSRLHIPVADYRAINRRHRGAVRSEMNTLPDSPISGCCDPADQY